MRRPSVHQLEIFCKVVELGSMARAADELYLAASSVSMQLQELERKFGARLLHRSRQRVVPTAAGQAVYARARSALESLDAIERDLAELSELQSGVLRFASSRTVGSYLVPVVLRAFESRYPKVDVEYHIMTSSEQAKLAVVEGRAEFALLGRVSHDTTLTITRLIDEPMLVVAAPTHAFAAMREPSLRQLAAYPLLVREFPVLASDDIRAAFEKAGLRARFVEFQSTEALKARAVEGAGIAFLPETSVRGELAEGTLVARAVEEFHPYRTVYVAHLCSAPLSAAARGFLDLATRLLAQPGAQVERRTT